jgi:hypothetical protein
MSEKITRITLNQAMKLRSLSVEKKARNMSDEEIDKIIENDPDLYQLTEAELAQFELVGVVKNEKK